MINNMQGFYYHSNLGDLEVTSFDFARCKDTLRPLKNMFDLTLLERSNEKYNQQRITLYIRVKFLNNEWFNIAKPTERLRPLPNYEHNAKLLSENRAICIAKSAKKMFMISKYAFHDFLDIWKHISEYLSLVTWR